MYRKVIFPYTTSLIQLHWATWHSPSKALKMYLQLTYQFHFKKLLKETILELASKILNAALFILKN